MINMRIGWFSPFYTPGWVSADGGRIAFDFVLFIIRQIMSKEPKPKLTNMKTFCSLPRNIYNRHVSRGGAW
jgi:hypothetical protein